jgi:hypothetical protein
LATVPYTTSKSSLKQRYIHLTNYSVNKKADAYVKNDNGSPMKTKGDKNKTIEEGADDSPDKVNDAQSPTSPGKPPPMPIESKLSFARLKEEYEKKGVNYEEVMGRIKDVIIKTVLSAEYPILQHMGGNKNKNTCFEIYGFDVLIDANLKPWLLEVNVSPSLSSSSPFDKQVKTKLLSDSLYLVGFRLIDRKLQEQEKAKQNKQRLLGFES